MKLNADQLYTLTKVAEHRRAALDVYSMDADTQRQAWLNESEISRACGAHVFNQDEWLVDVALMIDAIQPSAPIYLVAEDVNVDALAEAADPQIPTHDARIVVWSNVVAYFGGNGACLPYFSGTTKYVRMAPGLLNEHVWPSIALGMLAASMQPAVARPFGTNARYALARAKYKPRRDFYYVPNVRYGAPKQAPKGGHHASPVAHDRSAHKALLTRVAVEAVEAADLTKRGYTLAWTEQLPPEVIAGMSRRGKAPTPGTLNAYRWIDKIATRVNPDGERAQRVKLIR
jgi:hypothetical protein